MRIAFVMEQTLGSVTHYLNLRREQSEAVRLEPLWVPIAFQHSPFSWSVLGSLRARRAIARVFDEVDGLFVHTNTIALASRRYFGSKPSILSTDGTPLNKKSMRHWYDLKPQSTFAARAKQLVHRSVFRSAAGFVAWSEWAKASLVEDYGCRSEDVCIIPPGIDLGDFRPGQRRNELPRILFVGRNFARKGGDLLLDVFHKRLRGRAELELVTPAQLPAEDGVRVHSSTKANSPELKKLYADCDVFALPTRADCTPLAVMEALASGLPVVATQVGGIPDLVRAGETGELVPRDDAERLGDALEALVDSPARRQQMGALARDDAGHRFDARSNARRLFEFVRSRL